MTVPRPLPRAITGSARRPRSSTVSSRPLCASASCVSSSSLLLIAVGVHSFRRLPVDAYPDLSPPQVEVVTQWPGHAAEEVERLITVPIEVEMNGLPKLTVVRSISLYGLSDVRLTFEDGTDNYFARQQVFERLPRHRASGRSHAVASRRCSRPRASIYRYVLESPDRSPMELKITRGLGARAAVQVRARAWRTIPGSAARRCSTRCCSIRRSRRRRPLGAAIVATALAANNGNAGRRLLLRGRPVLLRARPRARHDAWRTSATSCSRCTTARPCSSRTSARSSSARRRASDSSGSTARTTPSRASS